uniref:Uncharacterized protein n=1 Tax=Bombyx mori nuclear polyhedrosis virus TaxID=271108 RepID=A0A224ATB6_NPVBM|nr:hypothetical protein [Bombyx mori nucleopolyhedrovirus]
MCITYCSKL